MYTYNFFKISKKSGKKICGALDAVNEFEPSSFRLKIECQNILCIRRQSNVSAFTHKSDLNQEYLGGGSPQGTGIERPTGCIYACLPLSMSFNQIGG